MSCVGRWTLLLALVVSMLGACKKVQENDSKPNAEASLTLQDGPYVKDRVAVDIDLPDHLPVVLGEEKSSLVIRKIMDMSGSTSNRESTDHSTFEFGPDRKDAIFAILKTPDARKVVFLVLKPAGSNMLTTPGICLVADETMGMEITTGSCHDPQVVVGMRFANPKNSADTKWLFAVKTPSNRYKCLGRVSNSSVDIAPIFALKDCTNLVFGRVKSYDTPASYILVEPKTVDSQYQGQDLGYADDHPYSKHFKRGFYDVDGSGRNQNYCRVVGSPESYVACSKAKDSQGASAFLYSTKGLDQGYDRTRGMFLVKGEPGLRFCRGVGMNSDDPDFACIKPVLDQHGLTKEWHSANKYQYEFMGTFPTMASYRINYPLKSYPTGQWSRAYLVAEFFTSAKYPFRFGNTTRMFSEAEARIRDITLNRGEMITFRGKKMGCPELYKRGFAIVPQESTACEAGCSLINNRIFIGDILGAPPAEIANNPRYVRNAFSDSSLGLGPSCWICPLGYERTIFAINDNKACEKISTSNP